MLALNVYRATTQSITIDEAFTYQNFVEPPWSQVLTSYDANHHVLNSVLAKLTTGAFGTSELALRLPSLVGGIIYLLAARAIVLYAFGSLWSVAAFLLLTLNPFVLDYLSAARGYGLALGFLVAALWLLLREDWRWAGFCLGLSVASNLSFLIPAAALIGVGAIVELRRGQLGRFADMVLVPAVVAAFIINIGPLSRATSSGFYWGAVDLATTARSLSIASLLRKAPPHAEAIARVAEILAVCVLAAGAVAFVMLVRRSKVVTVTEHLILLAGGAMWLCLAFSWLARVAFGVLYPLERTGLYWPVMLTFAAVALVERYARRRASQVVTVVLAALCVGQFLCEFEATCYAQWRWDAGTKRIAEQLGNRVGLGHVKIACSRDLRYSLTYYRMRRGAGWQLDPEPGAPANLYVLVSEEVRPGMSILYRDPVSQAVIATSTGGE